MFDVGFWEIVVVAVVALFVVRPERFPGMIRKAGYWVGQFRRMASTIKNEFEQEVDKAEQLQKLLEEQKQILERNANVDLTKPAVTPKSQRKTEEQMVETESKPATSEDSPRTKQ